MEYLLIGGSAALLGANEIYRGRFVSTAYFNACGGGDLLSIDGSV